MKKLLLGLTLIIATITLIGCSLLDETKTEGSVFDSKDSVIGFSALSSVITLHGSTDGTSLQDNTVTTLSTHTEDDTFAILSEIEELTPYLDLVSTFMGNGSNFSVDIQASDHEDYEHQMTIYTVNMEGETISYDMHYNETFDVDDDEEFDPEEYDSILEGIMIIDDVTYTLYAEREIDEGEESLELVAKLDDENYVTLDYEIEIDDDEYETEFLYEMFVNNQLVKSISIEFEQDEEETELEMKFVRGNRESEYDFEVEIDGNTRYVEIEYKITVDGDTVEEGEIEVTIVYDAETGQTYVRYEIESKGEKIIYDDNYDQPGLDNDEDDDEEDDEDDDEEDDEDDAEDEETATTIRTL